MHDTIAPSVLKGEFSRKVIQIRALVALGKKKMKNNPEKKFQLLFVTPAGLITGEFCELFATDGITCSDEKCDFDISVIDELANKVLMDAENEIVNIKLVDNAEFIKFTNAKISSLDGASERIVPQLLIYADQIIAFSLVEA